MRINKATLIVIVYVLIGTAMGIVLGFLLAELLHYPLPRVPPIPKFNPFVV